MAWALSARELTKSFSGFTAVDGVDLNVTPGHIHAVIGPNGAGKTTLFNLLMGSLRPTSGSVWLGDDEITGKPPSYTAKRGLVRTFQVTNVFPRLTVLESVECAIVARRRRSGDFITFVRRGIRQEALELVESVGLSDKLAAQSRTLSHGDQRVLEVSLALALKPKVLMLDEPTAGMSPYETERMVTLVRDLARTENLTVLLCEHDMPVVFSVADWITVLHQGRVIANGLPAEVRANEQVTLVYLGTDADDA